MKLLLALFLIISTPLISQDRVNKKPEFKSKMINGTEFTFKLVYMISEFNDEHDKVLELYRNNKKLLSHTLREFSGDSNSLSIEIGDYAVKDSTIIFYSYWGRLGDAPASPYGVRKQIYTILDSGKVKMKESLVYLDAGPMMGSYEGYKGLQFLDSAPKYKKEEELLAEYMRTIEDEYNARFVRSEKERDSLFDEVRQMMSEDIKKATANWDEFAAGYGTNFSRY